MAFPIPEHLPRKIPQDVSTQILTKISEVTSKDLTACLAEAWISELNETILQTKDRIHDRISNDLPSFERQLASSKSVQTRLLDLTANVDKVTDSLSNPETGLLPSLLSALSSHSSLAQQFSDAEALHVALDYLARCCDDMERLNRVVLDGKLAAAMNLGLDLQDMVDKAPEVIATTKVMEDTKRRLRTLLDRTQEQLSEAYARSVTISPTSFQICPSVKVRQSESTITISEILSSLLSDSLNSHLSSLRRDLISRFIDFPLKVPVSYTVDPSKEIDGAPSQTFSLFPLAPATRSYMSTIPFLQSLFDFLSTNFFPFLPSPVKESFPRSLCRPTVTAILREVLTPHLPTSLIDLPPYLTLLEDAVKFEQDYIIGVLRDDERGDKELKAWSDNAPSHYGRKRRTELLRSARTLITSISSEKNKPFQVEVPRRNEAEMRPNAIAVQGDASETEDSWDFEDEMEKADDSWGFEDTTGAKQLPRPSQSSEESNIREGNDWGFDEDAETAVENKSPDVPASGIRPKEERVSTNGNEDTNNAEEDPSDAWGWDDPMEEGTVGSKTVDETSSPSKDINGGKGVDSEQDKAIDVLDSGDAADDSAWDDPWDEPAPAEPRASTPPPPVRPISPPKQPKLARGLEKFSAKGKRAQSPSYTSSNPASPSPASPAFPSSKPSSSMILNSPRPSPSFPPSSSSHRSPKPDKLFEPRLSVNPPFNLKPKPKEIFTVTNRARELVNSVKGIISEGQDIYRSPIFSHFGSAKDRSSHSSPSSLVFQVAPYVLDLYRALYPITFQLETQKPRWSMQLSNDCLFIGEEVKKLTLPKEGSPSLAEQMHESAEKMKSLGEWWFDESIERVRTTVLNVLLRAEGFMDTGDQDRFDECESVMSDLLRSIRSSASDWKAVLPLSKYHSATGAVVEAVLTRILEDILALHDIPEVDSHRLSELCRILNALEGLFADGVESASMVVAYVPSWLKYSYLSELLEASIADISYLFDEGALIDFESDELVKLVKALFADTPLRTNTIAKLQRGHPSVSS